MLKFLKFNPFKSLTVGGVVSLAVVTLVASFDPNALSPQATTVLQTAATVVTVLGLRNSHAKTVRDVAATIEQLAAKKKGA